MGAITSSKSPASPLFPQRFIQAQIKENIKAPRHWPLCGEFPGTGEFPAQRASNAGKCCHLMTSSCLLPLRFFSNNFPWNSNDLPSRYSRNRYVFVFSSNIIIGTCKCGYGRAQKSSLSLLNVNFKPILSLIYRCFPTHFQRCRLGFYAWRRRTRKIFFI